ncbi:N-acetyltransferase cml2 [Globisporangium polare]
MAPFEPTAVHAPTPPALEAANGALPPVISAATNAEVHIRQFEPRDLKAVEELFSSGMLYYATFYPDLYSIWEGYVNESIQDDIARIDEVYIAPGGNFFVATIEDKVVGMVALEKKPDGEGELRRMSVNAEYRRFGLGRKLVAHLETWAKSSSYKRVWLSTGANMTNAVKFYPSIGYEHYDTKVFSQDPYFEAYYFGKDL